MALGGNSSSLDVVTHPESGVLIVYDENEFSVMWTREFKCRNYGGRPTRVEHVVLDIANNSLYLAFNPLVIVKMRVDSGEIE